MFLQVQAEDADTTAALQRPNFITVLTLKKSLCTKKFDKLLTQIILLCFDYRRSGEKKDIYKWENIRIQIRTRFIIDGYERGIRKKTLIETDEKEKY